VQSPGLDKVKFICHTELVEVQQMNCLSFDRLTLRQAHPSTSSG